MFGRFEGLDIVIGEFDTSIDPYISMHLNGIDQTGTTYVKPLMMLYSCLMTPPFSLAVALALRIYVSTKVFEIMVMRHTFPAHRRERRSSE